MLRNYDGSLRSNELLVRLIDGKPVMEFHAMARRSIPFADRFWRKVERTKDCWIWIGARTSKGYGRLHFGSRNQSQRAHRLSYMMEYGAIPRGMIVLHKCDNPPCVRPDHLMLGTPKDNSLDRVAKDRAPKGQEASWSKLTLEQVCAIKSDTRLQRVIAAEYGICQQSVSLIKRGINWRHVKHQPIVQMPTGSR
jgi:hypothetical protein